MSDVVRRELRLYGDVQGVGLRYRARYAASLYDATGWVRNEYDGSVTLALQGTEAQLGQVMEAILRGTFVHVERVESRDLPVDEDERGFESD